MKHKKNPRHDARDSIIVIMLENKQFAIPSFIDHRCAHDPAFDNLFLLKHQEERFLRRLWRRL